MTAARGTEPSAARGSQPSGARRAPAAAERPAAAAPPAGHVGDARALNWRFLVPCEPAGLLLLAAADETLPGAVQPRRAAAGLAQALDGGRSYPAVALPDVGAWSPLLGGGRGGRPAALLARAAAAVAPGGWLYAGFGNRCYPPAVLDRRALTLAAASRALAAAGLEPAGAWLAFPDHRCPAYLVGSSHPGELEYFLRTLFIPHVAGGSRVAARAAQLALAAGRRAALAVPPRLRPRLAPAYALVATRPTAP